VSRLAELEAIIGRHLRKPLSPIGTQSTAVTRLMPICAQSASVTDGSRCHKCGGGFETAEIAFRARTRRPSMFGWSITLQSYCERCCPKNRMYNFPDPCFSCGRQVAVEMDNNIYRRKRLTCSQDCAKRAEVTVRAQRRAEKRCKTSRRVAGRLPARGTQRPVVLHVGRKRTAGGQREELVPGTRATCSGRGRGQGCAPPACGKNSRRGRGPTAPLRSAGRGAPGSDYARGPLAACLEGLKHAAA
jgi:hypothetical protein